VEAQTGSGKTLSFLIPLLEKYLAFNNVCSIKEDDEDAKLKIQVKFILISPTR
jgi:superfamily II DNA/RNA helicase